MSEKEMTGFDGLYGDTCIAFIEYRRSLGYKYGERIVRAIRELNRYLNEHTTDNTINLTKEQVLGFAAKRENEQPMTQMRREALIRQLAVYLNSVGVPAYVLPEHQHERCSFVPYIFTREQICSLLKAADGLQYAYRSPNMNHVYPFLIRLLYCCGLRISEALSLKISDIDFSDRVITVRQSKYNNTRLVPMSESLFACLRNYMNSVGYSENGTGLLFRNRWGEAYRTGSILGRYKKLLVEAGVPCAANGRLPRLHDLRHTFAVHALESMVDKGIDTYVSIPYLEEYMGHRNIKCTEKYLRLTAESYDRIIDALVPLYNDMFKGGDEDE